jgi:hypothetical protein
MQPNPLAPFLEDEPYLDLEGEPFRSDINTRLQVDHMSIHACVTTQLTQL